MMTRGQVARRLGKSIATVRRMEGHLLHPWCDSHGIYRFSNAEVERLARGNVSATKPSTYNPADPASIRVPKRDEQRTDRSPEATMADAPLHASSAAECTSRVERLEQRLREQRIESEQISVLKRRCRELEDANQRLHALLNRELRSYVSSLPRRQHRQLLDEYPDLLDDLADLDD